LGRNECSTSCPGVDDELDVGPDRRLPQPRRCTAFPSPPCRNSRPKASVALSVIHGLKELWAYTGKQAVNEQIKRMFPSVAR
jgi:hypothetical protein